jgi:hypothetical protein
VTYAVEQRVVVGRRHFQELEPALLLVRSQSR